ncbi:MAG: hypothetical protein IJ645_08970 [Ruminococcus sp.]|nr:hypothetical protein [Ruminococcus sp.]
MKKQILKKGIMRLTAACLAYAMVQSALFAEYAYAVFSEGTPAVTTTTAETTAEAGTATGTATAAVTTTTEGTTTVPTATTPAAEEGVEVVTTTAQAAAPAAESTTIDTSDISITQNGEEQETEQSTDPWLEQDIVGEYAPSKEAPAGSKLYSVETFPTYEDMHLYTLTISTGMNDGSNVEYFAVRYKDENGAAQTKYIFPNGGSYKTSWNCVGGLDNGVKYNTIVFSAPYLDLDKADRSALSRMGKETDFDGTKKKNLTSLQYIKRLMYETKPLQPWSVDEYLFTAPTGMTEVTGIEAFLSKGEWTIQGMTVSRVTDIGGIREYGFYSGQYYLALGKQKLAEFKSNKSGAATIPASKDMLVNVGGSSSPYFSLKKTDQTVKNPMQDLYTFRLDITDELNAGLESLLRNDSIIDLLSDYKGIEDIALEIEYTDKNGWTRMVTMPVLLSVIGQTMLLGDKIKTMGIAQRGESLSFTGCLPEFSSLISARIYVGGKARERLKETGGFMSLNEQAVETARKNLDDARKKGVASKEREAQTAYDRALNTYNEAMETYADLDSNDYIALSGIYLYKGTCRMSNTRDGTDPLTTETLTSYTYDYAYETEKPIYGFSTTIESGYRINPGTSDKVEMAAFTDESQMLSAKYPGNFLVRLKTGDAYGAGTTGGIKVQITYQNYSGQKVTSQVYDVKEEVTNYLGYWPSTTDKKSDFAFNYNAQTGHFLDFPVTLENATAIISVDVSLDSYTNDEWQFGGVAMYVVDYIGPRRIYARDSEVDDTSDPTLSTYMASRYVISRTVTKTLLPPFPFTIEKLLTPGDKVPLDIGTGTVTPVQEIDFESMRYSMSYDQTKLDLGFVKSKKVYDIDVKVADDSTSSNANGDSGSHNQFYFQLQFKNGETSAFVLANQQLSSDGFRAGFNERFAIAVNRDYGEVSDIRIIPESTSTDSDVFDKLNIEEITITERTYGGASTQYVVNQVGWVGMGIIDYRDSAEISSIKGLEGRFLNSVSKTYHVADKRNVTNFLCEVSTLPWDTDYINVQGSVSCDIEYVDDNDQPRTMSFDVISLMADYMKKTPIYYEAPSDGSQDALYVNMGTISDPRWMLRPNHKDRFILTGIANVKSLKTITFSATSRNNKPGKWVIGGISVSRVLKDGGTVELSKKYSEYIRSMETEPFCNTGSQSKELFMPAGMTESVSFDFSENEVTWAEDKSWPAAVSRIPDSSNDSLNIYIFPSEDTPDIENVNVKTIAQYSVPFSQVIQIKESAMRVYGSGTSDAMFYVTGLNAKGMESLVELGVECRNSRIVFDRALVQQVRDGVIVNNYEILFRNQSAIFGLSTEPENYVNITQRNSQKLYIQLDSVTEAMSLFAKNNDNNIAVALKYRSSLDHSDTDYYSPYVYLTDIGINKIYPGMMIEVPFEIPYLSEITGYRIVSYGNIKANVLSAVAQNYSFSSKAEDPETGTPVYADETLLNNYSFNENFALSSAIKEARVTAGDIKGKSSVTPIDVYIKTADAQEGMESGTDSLVEMTVSYIDYNGNPKKLVLKDLRSYIQSDNKTFKTGETVRVSFFIPEFRELESFTVYPKDGTGRANWTIETIEGSILGETLFSRAVNQTFTEAEEGGTIALKNVNISTIVTTSAGYLGPTIGHLKEFTMDGETTATFSVRVDGGLGYEVKAAWLINDTQTDVQQLISAVQNTGAAGSFKFTAPKNTTSLPQTYVIEVSAKDNPSVKDILRVTIPVPAAAAAPTAQPGDEYYDDYDDSAHDNWGDDNEDSTADQTAPESSQSSQDSTTPSVDDSTPSGENVFTDTTTSQSGSGEQQTP